MDETFVRLKDFIICLSAVGAFAFVVGLIAGCELSR